MYKRQVNISHCLESLTNSIFIVTGNGNPENVSVADMYKNKMCIRDRGK